jgi:CheY-like chemotaxis protein
MAKRRILIVEDDDELRHNVAVILGEIGYLVVSAPNGREALQLLVADDLPDLILLDLRMPVMDGWEFARVLRYYRRFAEIPIVVISALAPGPGPWHPSVDGVVAKPFTPSALLNEVEKHAPLEHSPI